MYPTHLAHPNTVICFPAQPSLRFIIATCSPKPEDVLLCCFVIVCLEDGDMNLGEIPGEKTQLQFSFRNTRFLQANINKQCREAYANNPTTQLGHTCDT